jgi:hypothetical protein
MKKAMSLHDGAAALVKELEKGSKKKKKSAKGPARKRDRD